MGTSGLETVFFLDKSHKQHVFLENDIDCSFQIFLQKDSHLEATEQKCYEVKLMARSVVKTLILTERLHKIYLNFWNCSFKAFSR